jgi:hypothetical protein
MGLDVARAAWLRRALRWFSEQPARDARRAGRVAYAGRMLGAWHRRVYGAVVVRVRGRRDEHPADGRREVGSGVPGGVACARPAPGPGGGRGRCGATPRPARPSTRIERTRTWRARLPRPRRRVMQPPSGTASVTCNGPLRRAAPVWDQSGQGLRSAARLGFPPAPTRSARRIPDARSRD